MWKKGRFVELKALLVYRLERLWRRERWMPFQIMLKTTFSLSILADSLPSGDTRNRRGNASSHGVQKNAYTSASAPSGHTRLSREAKTKNLQNSLLKIKLLWLIPIPTKRKTIVCLPLWLDYQRTLCGRKKTLSVSQSARKSGRLSVQSNTSELVKVVQLYWVPMEVMSNTKSIWTTNVSKRQSNLFPKTTMSKPEKIYQLILMKASKWLF